MSATMFKDSSSMNLTDNSGNKNCRAAGSKDITVSFTRGLDEDESADNVSIVCEDNIGMDMCVTGLDEITLRMTEGPA